MIDTRFFPLDCSQPRTDELTGRRVNFHYASGNVLQQYYESESSITWKGVSGAFAGVEQTEDTLHVFKVGPSRYLICWYEAATVATAEQGTVYSGGFPVAVYADFEAKIATAAYTNPSLDGGHYYTIDQATIEVLES